MKTRINLYIPELRPIRKRLTLFRMMICWGGLLGLLLVSGGALKLVSLQRTQAQLQLQEQLQTIAVQTTALNTQLQARHLDVVLEHELALRKEEIKAKQQLQSHLQQMGTLQNQGFSSWLYDLANARTPEIALQSFEIENDQLRLQGEASSNDAVPAWISHFAQYPTLRNRTFSALQVARQKSGALQFSLESRDHAASAAKGTAP